VNLHEYQAKEVFSAYGIPVPAGRVAATAEEAVSAANALGGSVWVVKAQVHAGGRGKAGGVKLARDVEGVRAAAQAMLGTRLATKQTGPEGLPVDKVYVEQGSQIEREIYLSLTLNREKGRIAMVGSAAGGMDIEEVASTRRRRSPRSTSIRLRACSRTNVAAWLSRSGSRVRRSPSSSRSRWRSTSSTSTRTQACSR